MRVRAIASSSEAAGARAHGDPRALLGRVAERVGAPQAVGEGARGEGPGAVRAVPADLGAGIDDHGLPHADLPAAGMMVGQRSIRPGGDDHRERQRVGSLIVQHLLQPPGDVCLGAADELLLRKPLVGGVGDAGRARGSPRARPRP